MNENKAITFEEWADISTGLLVPNGTMRYCDAHAAWQAATAAMQAEMDEKQDKLIGAMTEIARLDRAYGQEVADLKDKIERRDWTIARLNNSFQLCNSERLELEDVINAVEAQLESAKRDLATLKDSGSVSYNIRAGSIAFPHQIIKDVTIDGSQAQALYKAEIERDGAIKAYSEEARKRGAVEAALKSAETALKDLKQYMLVTWDEGNAITPLSILDKALAEISKTKG